MKNRTPQPSGRSGRNEAQAETVELAFERFGAKASPLVILHGLFGAARNWRRIAADLNARSGHSVFTLDLRHHGESPKEGAFDLDLMAEDVCRFIDGRIGGASTLLGHSLGGKIALRMLAICPERVKALILADISPFQLSDELCRSLRQVAEALRDALAQDFGSRNEAASFLEQRLGSREVSRFLVQNYRRSKRGDEERGYWQIGIGAIMENFQKACRPVLDTSPDGSLKKPQWNGPFLCMRGSQSPYFPPADMMPLRLAFENIEFRTLQGAGHWLHVEQRERFIEILEDFLK